MFRVRLMQNEAVINLYAAVIDTIKQDCIKEYKACIKHHVDIYTPSVYNPTITTLLCGGYSFWFQFVDLTPHDILSIFIKDIKVNLNIDHDKNERK